MIVILVELNRIPFDFLEGESELISGINLEFSSFNFIVLIIIEYLDIIFIGIFRLLMFINIKFNLYINYINLIFILILILLFRGFIVRYRLDKLLNLI